MAENITASAGTTAEEFMRTTRRRELVKLVGDSTAAGDTSPAFTCSFLTAPSKVEGGAFAGTFSGRTVVFTALVALGSSSVWVWVSE